MIRKAAHHIKQHLVPTEHNGFVPHLLREKSVWAMLCLGLGLFAFVQVARVTNYFGLPAEVYPAVITTLTNEDREENDLAPLTTSTTLEAAAKLKAEDMAAKSYFAHTSPEGITPWHWFAKAGYKFIYAGENLAVNYTESAAVQKAWLNSPTHRANIMNENFTEIGVATAEGVYNGVPTTFVVEMFGMPAQTKVAAAEVVAPPAEPAPAPVKAAVAAAPIPQPAEASPVPVEAPLPRASEVAGESAPTLTILEETPTFTMAQNSDTTLEPGNPQSAPAPKASWIKRFILQSDKLAGFIMQVIIILAIIATAGMVAREYEKHHKKHMAYGALVAVIMFASLFVGRLGVFGISGAPTASTSLLPSTTVLQE